VADEQLTTPPAGQSSGGWALSQAGREVRLGLVVYGGVSLAIYINGVADELFRAVRGRGIYKLLKRLLDSDIVVDIISGTSAGGINGLFLAFALANEREFSDCAALWREQGSLAKLLRLVDDETKATSLLDSKNYYLPQLEHAFRSMSEIQAEVRSTERPSVFHELDVFVTGTNFDGQLSTVIDATGRQIDVKTHRTVFHLKHRHERKTPFAFTSAPGRQTPEDRARVAALAKLAAITSCFPAAFEPVKVADADPGSDEHRVYAHLREWGALNGEAWFLDGGVLDNKPFSYTIREIFHRNASRPVDRKLFYVEPDPERFNISERKPRLDAPNAVQSAVQALFGIPGYESISEDLHQIFQRNDRLERLGRARSVAERAMSDLQQSSVDGTPAIPPSVARIYEHTRLAQLSNRVVQGLLVDKSFSRPLHGGEGRPSSDQRTDDAKNRRIGAALARAFNEWTGEGAITLERYDVYIRRRRLFHLVYRLLDRVSKLCGDIHKDSTAPARAQSLKHVWEQVNAQLETFEIIQWAMENAMDAYPFPKNAEPAAFSARETWIPLSADLDRVLAVDAVLEPAFLADAFSDEQRKILHTILKNRLDELRSQPAAVGPAADVAPPNLLQRLDAQATAFIARVSETHPEVGDAWRDFDWYDAHFFPIDYFGDLGEKDPIEVVRVSPVDAERSFSSRQFEDKITGETVMHFGAFLKKAWRSNDIMWGRLDGACRLLDALMTPSALTRSMANGEIRELLRADLDGELHPKVLFPNSGDAVQREVLRWLRDLSSPDESLRTRALEDSAKYDLLLWCAQLEILHENLPTVLEDATTEQLEWSNVRTDRGFRKNNLRIDRATGRLIGKQVTSDFIERLRKDPSPFTQIPNAPIARFFMREYAVGAENVKDDIPTSVLLETMTATSLVARNCLLHAFPDQGEKLRANLFFRALVQWPMMTAHALAVLARRERTLYLAAVTALFTYALVALIGGVVWLRVDVRTGEDVDRLRLLLLVVFPLLILTVGSYLSWLSLNRHAGRSWSAALTRTGAAILSAAVLVPIVAAFFVAWQTTNDQLRQWMAAAPTHPIAQLLLPDAFRQWLAQSIADGDRFTVYPLVALVAIFVLVVPTMRGFIQSRVARMTAGPTLRDSSRLIVARVAKWMSPYLTFSTISGKKP
jgi:patatin-related protein